MESRFKSSLPESLNTRDETEHTTIPQLFLPKKKRNPNLIKPPDLTTYLQEEQGTDIPS